MAAVYVGGGNGDLLALDLGTGQLRWKYKTGNLIGESSPTVSRDAVYIGDLGGIVHAVDIRDATRLWTFKTGSEIKSSPVLVDGAVLIGSYDGHLYALDAKTGKLRWKVQTKGQVHATPAVQNGLAFIAGCDAIFRAIRVKDGREMYQIESGAYTGASPVVEGDRAYFGTFNFEVLALDLKARRIAWRYSQPDAQFPYYSVGRARRRPRDCGRPRQGRPRDRCRDRQVGVDVRDAGTGGLVSRSGGRPRLHRFRRRPALRARLGVWKEALGVRHRRRHHRIPAVAAGKVVIGAMGPRGDRARRRHPRRHAPLDVQDRIRDQVVTRSRGWHRAHRVVRRTSLCARRQDREAALEGSDEGPGARHPRGAEWPHLHRRM